MSSSFTLKYKVLEKIGEGSFSEVLKCQNRETDELFAAKRLKKCYRNRQEVYECPEIIAMRKISRHPNILYIIETHYEQLLGRVTLIFELLDMSIYDFMKVRKRCVPEHRVKNYIYQLLKGLHHLHKNGLFHRDIKPENILIKLTNNDPLSLTKGEIVKLGDLGSIRGIYSKPPYTEYISTRWYRSPECLLTTGYYGPKMDIWAVGCVFYEMLTLKPLFPGNDEIDQIHRIHQILGTPTSRLLSKFRRHKSRNCDVAFPNADGTGFGNLIPTISTDGREVLKQMLVYDPDHRSNVRRVLDHRYFNDLRLQDVTWRKSIFHCRATNSEKSIGDWRSKCNEQQKQQPSMVPVQEPSNGLKYDAVDVIRSEIISNDATKSLHSKSGSINLNRIVKKKNASSPEGKAQLNKPAKQIRTWDVNSNMTAKLSLLKTAQAANIAIKNNKLKDLETVFGPKKDPANFYAKLKSVSQLTQQISDSGSYVRTENPAPKKQFTSKSFVLPCHTSGKAQLATIDEKPKSLKLKADYESNVLHSKKATSRQRPMGRRNIRKTRISPNKESLNLQKKG